MTEANALAVALGADQPLIAMRSLAGIGGSGGPPSAEVRQVAERYIQILLARDLPQSVVIGGNCQAVPFAFQIANALAMAGHAAASVIFLERMLPVPYGGRMLILFGRDSRRHNPVFQYADPTAAWGRYLRDGHFALIDGNHGKFFRPENIGSLSRVLRDEIDTASQTGWFPALARRAEITVRVQSASARRVSIRVRNPNERAFDAGGDSHIALAIHALGQAEGDSRPLRVPDQMIPLPQRIPPGAMIDVTATLPDTGAATGRYLVSLCEEGVGWFELTAGSEPLVRL